MEKMLDVSEPLGNPITYGPGAATGEGFINSWVDKKSPFCVIIKIDRSGGLNYIHTDENESNCLDWTSVVRHYLKEPNEFFKIHSGISGWPKESTRTSSPLVDQSKASIIIDGVANFNNGITQKKATLNRKFANEKVKYFNYFQGSVDEAFVDKLFKNVTDDLVRIPYNGIAVEITPDKSIFFEVRIGEAILHFKLIISNKSEPKAFFALYKNSVCLDNGVGPINDILNHLLDIKHDGVSSNTVAKEVL